MRCAIGVPHRCHGRQTHIPKWGPNGEDGAATKATTTSAMSARVQKPPAAHRAEGTGAQAWARAGGASRSLSWQDKASTSTKGSYSARGRPLALPDAIGVAPGVGRMRRRA